MKAFETRKPQVSKTRQNTNTHTGFRERASSGVLQELANQSSIVSELNALQRMANEPRNSPEHGCEGNGDEVTVAVVQRISTKNALERLAVEGEVTEGDSICAEVIVLINNIISEIPKILNALSGFDAYLLLYPIRPPVLELSRSGIKYELSQFVKQTIDKLGPFAEVLEGYEQWYIDNPENRNAAAVENVTAWRNANTIISHGAAAILNIFSKKCTHKEELLDSTGYLQFRALRGEISSWLGTSSGFSAIGRANPIEAEVVFDDESDHASSDALVKDNSFYAQFLLGRGTLNPPTKGVSVYKDVGPEAKSGPVIVDGKMINTVAQAGQKGALLETVTGKLAPLNPAPPLVTYRATPAPRDRGDGQFSEMAKTNARGYAWLTDTPGWDSSKWEWLHVRAASLGGSTDSSNLVLGTRDANTMMMPFEAHIRALGSLVKDHDGLNALTVRWLPGSQNGASHKWSTISAQWQLEPAGDAGPNTLRAAQYADGEIRINTINAATRLSKVEVKTIEEMLTFLRHDLAADPGSTREESFDQ